MRNSTSAQHIFCHLLTFFILICISVSGAPAQTEATGENTATIPDVFLPFEAGGTPQHVILVEKSSQTLYLYEYDGTIREIYRMACSTGKAPGPKQRSGDSKTPEGIYFFTTVHEDKELSPIYGIRAFPTDYPNLMDRITGRTGSAIWLHGTNKDLKPRDSNGCIVLENENLEKITPNIALHRTPIIVVDRISYASVAEKTEQMATLSELVRGWTDAISSGTYHDYVGFYDAGYVPDIAWWSDWHKVRRRLIPAGKDASVDTTVRNLSVFKHNNEYVMLFDLHVGQADRDALAGTKKLFLKEDGDRFVIVGESYQKVPDGADDTHPVLLASRRLRTPAAPDTPAEEQETWNVEVVDNMVDEWLKAWSSQDIEDYGQYYASDFSTRGMDKEAWLRYKKSLNRKYDYINVTKRDLVARQQDDSTNRLTVSFVQNYESSGFKASGIKTLILKREGNGWKIYRETWKKM